MKYMQYILVDEQGEKATRTHQDDSETNLGCATLQGLIEEIADWLDTDSDHVKEQISGDKLTLNVASGRAGDVWTIKKEIINEVELDENDLRDLKYQLSLNN